MNTEIYDRIVKEVPVKHMPAVLSELIMLYSSDDIERAHRVLTTIVEVFNE